MFAVWQEALKRWAFRRLKGFFRCSARERFRAAAPLSCIRGSLPNSRQQFHLSFRIAGLQRRKWMRARFRRCLFVSGGRSPHFLAAFVQRQPGSQLAGSLRGAVLVLAISYPSQSLRRSLHSGGMRFPPTCAGSELSLEEALSGYLHLSLEQGVS